MKEKMYYGFLNSRGSVLLELALIMPILILTIAGIVQFGFILNAKIAVNAAAYEAARAATISDNPHNAALNTIENYAGSNISGWSFNERLKADINISGTDPGSEVAVEVIYGVPVFFSKVAPFDSFFPDKVAEIRGRAVMRVEEKE